MLEWAVSFQFHTRTTHVPPLTQQGGWRGSPIIGPRANGRFSHRLLLSHPGFGSLESCYAGTHSTLWGPLSFKGRRWDLRDRSEAEWTGSHGSQWVTLATGCVLASARTLAIQGKPALNRCTKRMSCRWERQLVWVASTCKSLRCIWQFMVSICFHIYTSTFKFQLRNGEDLGYSTDCQPGFFCTNRRGCAPHFVFGIIL